MSMEAVVEGVAQVVGFQTKEMKARDQLAIRDESERRLGQDPNAMSDVVVQGAWRVHTMTVAQLEQAKARIMAEAQATCDHIDSIMQAMQERSAPVMQSVEDYLADLSYARELAGKSRLLGKRHDPD